MTIEELQKENKELRKLLWLRHGCPIPALYGDDGEMQCGVCLLDFKRMSPADIEERWLTTAQRKLHEVLLTTVPKETTDEETPEAG